MNDYLCLSFSDFSLLSHSVNDNEVVSINSDPEEKKVSRGSIPEQKAWF